MQTTSGRSVYALGLALFGCLALSRLSAGPTGGQVVAGSASLSGSDGSLTVTQTSSRAIINWQDFSIEAGQFARFIQPDATSATLNRVVSNLPSDLEGSLQANGQVYLINPNGVLIGAGARIDTGGFLASTLDVTNEEFMAGGDLHFGGSSTAAVQNLGAINALGGDVFLIARQVDNQGTIAAANGTAGLASGSEILLTTGGDERLFVQAASLPGSVVNSGSIAAATAELKAAGGNAFALAINNSGIVRATGSADRGGQVWLVASGDSTVENSGSIDVSSASGQGGSIALSGGHVLLDGSSTLDATGATGGGTVEVGGGWQGGDTSLPNASAVVMQPGATIDASATQSGNGGTVSLWSQDYTSFLGSISAKGGQASGDGGHVETSSLTNLDAEGSVDASAPVGSPGAWLLDPVNVTIASSGASGSTFANPFVPTSDSVILASSLATALNGGSNVSVSTGSTGSSTGDLNVNTVVSWTANSTLTLSAYHNINFNLDSGIVATGATAGLVLTPNTGNGGGSYSLGTAASITLSGATPSLTISGISYTVINSVGVAGDVATNTLQGMANNLSGHFALGSEIDATVTSNWNSGLGFTPVGNSTTPFTGTLDGLGHAVHYLTINDSTDNDIGLFGFTTGAILRNVGMTCSSISGNGYVGTLIGEGTGTVSYSYSTGSVTGAYAYIGGLVGYSSAGMSFDHDYNAGTVTGPQSVGGIIGQNGSGGSVTHSYNTGSISSNDSFGELVGGLVGYNYGTVDQSYSTGSVSGNGMVGGLVGANRSHVSNSYATGTVTGTGSSYYIGGLVGENNAFLDNDYATGTVQGTTEIGGLLGYNTAQVNNCYATGNVIGGTDKIGGLVGWIYQGTLANGYATGAVSGSGSVGGVVGENDVISGIGSVTGTYWNLTTSGQTAGIGAGTLTGATGLTTAQMRTASNFSAFTFTTTTGASGNNWVLVDANGTLNNSGSAAGATYPMLASEYSTAITGDHQLQLVQMAPSANYTLTADIAALSTGNNTDVWGSSGFVPLGTATSPYMGTFDGQGHSISNLTINLPTTDSVGLFGTVGKGTIGGVFIGGTLINVGLINPTVTGRDSVGALVGAMVNGAVGQTYVDNGTVTGTADVGGLIGHNDVSGVITTSVVTQNSYTDGVSVNGTLHVGGLVGTNDLTGTITNGYSAATVNGTTGVGELVGDNLGTMTTSFWNSTDKATGIGLGTTTGAAGMTAAQLQQQANFTSATTANGNSNPNWDFSNTWVQYQGNTDPLLRVFMKPITIAATNDSKTYNGLAYTGGNGVTYLYCPDNSLLLGTLSYGGSSQGDINAGTYVLTPQGLYSNQQGYIITYLSGSLTVNKANLTLTGTEVYNGTTAYSAAGLTANGVHGETFSIVGAGATGNLASKNVQTAQALLTLTGLSLSTSSNGGLASNYNALSITGSSVNVTPASLILVGSQVYNGGTAFAGSNLTANGVNNETFTITGAGATGDLSTKNVQSGQNLASVSGLSLGTSSNGGLASNYMALSVANSKVSVTPATLTLSGTQVYNGTTDFAGAGLTATGVNGETFTVTGTGATGNLTSKNVQTAQLLASVSGLSLGTSSNGGLAGNYNALTVTGSSVSVTPAALVLTGTRTFDGTTTFAGAALTADGVNGETFTLTGAGTTGAVATKNVQTNQPLLTVTGLSLGTSGNGGLSSNYTALSVTGSTVSITPANVTVSTINVIKTYDGNTSALGSPIVTVGQLFTGDTLALGSLGGNFVFVGKDVGIGNKTVVVSGISVNDGNGGHNYNVTLANNTTSTINKATLTLSGTEVYNATTAFPGASLTATGVNGETFTVTGAGSTGNLTTANVQTNQPLATVTGLTLGTSSNGGLAGNYNVLGVTGSTVSVTPASLVLTGTRVYDGTSFFPGIDLTATGVGGQTFTVTGAGAAGNVSTQNVQTNQPLASLTGLSLSTSSNGGLSSNYTALSVTGSSVSVTPASLTLSGTQVYNGTTAFAGSNLTATGVNGETFTVTGAGATGDLSTQNVQTNQALASVGGLALGTSSNGGLSSNYTALSFTGSSVSVTPATLVLSGSRTYNATSVFAGSSLTATGVNGETFTVTGAGSSGNLASKNVQTNQLLANLTGLSLGASGNGGLSSNYTALSVVNSSVSVTPATLILSGTQVYNATTVFAGSNLTATGVGGETFTVTGAGSSGNLASKNVQANQVLASLTGLSLGTSSNGGLSSNYTALSVTGSSVSVTAASLTLSGTQVYNGTTVFTGSNLTATGVNGESFTVTGSGSTGNLASKDVQTGQALASVAGLGVGTGNSGAAISSNYSALSVTGSSVSVTPAPLTITADNKSRAPNVANPTLTATYTGLVNGESSSVVSGLSLTTPAVLASPTGSYAITASGATAADYSITFVPGTLTIGQLVLTIGANSQSMTYGSSLPSFTAYYSGFVNGDTSAIVTGLQFNTSASSSSSVGTYTVTPFGATAPNYAIAYVPGTLTINPASLTITANSFSRLYGASDPVFTASFSGLVNGDSPSAISGLLITSGATAASNVGSYPIVPSGATASNYSIAYVPGTLAVTPAPLTITANNQSRAFDVANPPLTTTFTGLVNGDSTSVVSGLTVTTTAVLTSPGGTYPITPAGGTASNYAITFVPGVLAVNEELLTITANSLTKVYGAPLPTFTASYSGFVNGDTASVVTGLQFSTSALASSNVGTYTVTPFGASAPSYVIAYVPGTLTINPASLTISANNASRLYGSANPAFGVTYAGLVNGDTSSVVSGLSVTSPASAASNVGTYVVTPSSASAPNYTIGYVPGSLVVNPAPLTVTANGASRVYGSTNPTFGASYAGFVNGDTSGVVSGLTITSPATLSSNVGTYAITPSGAVASNYVVSFVPGSLAITPASLTISAGSASRTYGAANPAFSVTYAGFVNGDSSSVVSGLTITSAATPASNVGTYAITPSGAVAPNYTVSFVPGVLTVNPASLTITANSASRAFGDANPAFGATETGFVNGDTVSVISGLTLSTSATSASPAGTYSITPSGAKASNYTITFASGVLTVSQPSVSVGPVTVPVVVVNQVPLTTPTLSVVLVDNNPVLVSSNSGSSGSAIPSGTSPSVDQTLTLTLDDSTGRPAAPTNVGLTGGTTLPGFSLGGGQNFGSFEFVSALGGSETRLPGQDQNQPGLYRESEVNMGGFNVIYHEPVAEAARQSQSNTALGSSYREFSDSDNPQTAVVRAKVERKPATGSTQPTS